MDILIIVLVVIAGVLVIGGGVYILRNYFPKTFSKQTQEEWRKEWRLQHSNSMRGNLVRTFEEPIENFYYLDVEKQLGKGGCGVVVTGHHKESGTEFAIKVVVKATAERSRLDREIKLLKDVDHANIVRLFEVYDSPMNVYFVMEICTGGHLGDLLNRQPNSKCLDEEWAKVLIRQLVSAVAHLHSRGICHRDIKLQNILMENLHHSAQIKLIDFGYGSRFIGALPMRTKCGTPYTTAPEVLRECYDQRCDVWSVGVVAFIVLAGKRPFEILDVPGQLADAGKAVMLTNILMGRYHFNPAHWGKLTPGAQEFTETLLHHDYKTRVQAEEALEHPWLRNKVVTEIKLNKTVRTTKAVNNMRRNSKSSALRRTGLIALVFGLAPSKATDIRSLFQSIDVDNSGSLDVHEFTTAINQLAPELSAADVQTLFHTIDIDGNQLISYTEFLAATLDPREIDIEEFSKAFRLLDADGNGFIDVSELETVLRTRIKDSNEKPKETAGVGKIVKQKSFLSQIIDTDKFFDTGNSGKVVTADDVDAKIKDILAKCDLNGDGMISYEEFLIAMTENVKVPAFNSGGVEPSSSSPRRLSSSDVVSHSSSMEPGSVSMPSNFGGDRHGYDDDWDSKKAYSPGGDNSNIANCGSFSDLSHLGRGGRGARDDVGGLAYICEEKDSKDPSSVYHDNTYSNMSKNQSMRRDPTTSRDDSFGVVGGLNPNIASNKNKLNLPLVLNNLNNPDGFLDLNNQSPRLNSLQNCKTISSSNIAIYSAPAEELLPGSARRAKEDDMNVDEVESNKIAGRPASSSGRDSSKAFNSETSEKAGRGALSLKNFGEKSIGNGEVSKGTILSDDSLHDISGCVGSTAAVSNNSGGNKVLNFVQRVSGKSSPCK